MKSKYHIQAIETGSDQTIFTIFEDDRRFTYSSSSMTNILVNGQPLVSVPFKSYGIGYFYVDGKIESATRTVTEYYNHRYELKNNELYNEKIPLIIDDTSREIYQSLIDADLYIRKSDSRKHVFDIEVFTQTITDEFPFALEFKDLKVYRKNSYYRDMDPFLIDHVKYSETDLMMMPLPIVSMTRPVLITPEVMFKFFIDSVYSLHDKSRFRVSDFSETSFDVISSGVKRTKVFSARQWSSSSNKHSNLFKEELYFKTYNDMIDRVNEFAIDFTDAMNSHASHENLNEIVTKFREKYSVQSW